MTTQTRCFSHRNSLQLTPFVVKKYWNFVFIGCQFSLSLNAAKCQKREILVLVFGHFHTHQWYQHSVTICFLLLLRSWTVQILCFGPDSCSTLSWPDLTDAETHKRWHPNCVTRAPSLLLRSWVAFKVCLWVRYQLHLTKYPLFVPTVLLLSHCTIGW